MQSFNPVSLYPSLTQRGPEYVDFGNIEMIQQLFESFTPVLHAPIWWCFDLFHAHVRIYNNIFTSSSKIMAAGARLTYGNNSHPANRESKNLPIEHVHSSTCGRKAHKRSSHAPRACIVYLPYLYVRIHKESKLDRKKQLT